jgi:hypothetical protein
MVADEAVGGVLGIIVFIASTATVVVYGRLLGIGLLGRWRPALPPVRRTAADRAAPSRSARRPSTAGGRRGLPGLQQVLTEWVDLATRQWTTRADLVALAAAALLAVIAVAVSLGVVDPGLSVAGA